jgi:hypothetical protein
MAEEVLLCLREAASQNPLAIKQAEERLRNWEVSTVGSVSSLFENCGSGPRSNSGSGSKSSLIVRKFFSE